MLKRSQRFSRIALTLGALRVELASLRPVRRSFVTPSTPGRRRCCRGRRVTAGTLRIVRTTCNG